MKYAVPKGELVQEKAYSVLASVMFNESIWQILRSLVIHNDTEWLKQTIKYILTIQVQMKLHEYTEQVHISFQPVLWNPKATRLSIYAHCN